MDETQIRTVVREVIQEVLGQNTGATPVASGSGNGVFENVDDAIDAAKRAQRDLDAMTLEARGRVIDAIRAFAIEHAEDLSRRTFDETGMGRVEHKVIKHQNAAKFTPGIEMLKTTAWSGDHGLTIEEMAPFGLIGAVTPSTHPAPTMIANAINFIASGNTGVFNPHPAGKNVSAYAVGLLNQAMMAAGAPANCITSVAVPTIESAQRIFTHPSVDVLLITGGPGVVAEALKAPKRAICAGPGNPPVVVDETADLKRAARSIVDGATFDNNILCTSEKQVFCVDSVFDELKKELLAYQCVELSKSQIDALAKNAFGVSDPHDIHSARLSRDLVGRDASVLASSIGMSVPDSTMMLIGETDFDHVFVQEEQMMPFMPLVRCRNASEAIDMAVKSEHGFHHSAMIHSLNVENMSKMGRLINTTIFVKNGPSFAGNGTGGEGYSSFSIATPTGEGITSPVTFTRKRRCALVDYFRII